MTKKQYNEFKLLRDEFKKKIDFWNKKYGKLLKPLIEKTEGYEVCEAFIYNNRLDNLEEKDEIKYIWVQDNPGYNEMLQGKYAVGSSGKAGQNFLLQEKFIRDFDKEVIVLNKSPLHTKVTADLLKLENFDIQEETQKYMAGLIFRMHSIFNCDLWILGISNFGKIFSSFRKAMETDYNGSSLIEKIYLYYHFSQGQFKKAYNIKKKEFPDKDVQEILDITGMENREKYLVW